MEAITFAEMAEASRRRPGCDKVEQYAEIQKMRLEKKRADEDRAVMHPYESTFDRVIREGSERHKAANVPFRAHSSEIALAKAKCGDNASDAVLIASIRARREWERTHQAEIQEAAARAPKASHGRPVSRQTTLREPAQRPQRTGRDVELREDGNPGMCSLADMGLR